MKPLRSKTPFLFFAADEKRRIVETIQRAERTTTAEIRVHLDAGRHPDTLEAAKKAFEKLGMTQTQEKNGVLFFLCTHTHRFAVLGDRGIDSKVPTDFWKEISELLSRNFSENLFAEGLTQAIERVGQKLAAFFPHHAGDVNELPDGVSFS